MRGATSHNKLGSSDPLLRAVAELRDQIDRLIDEQQVALDGFASGLDGDRNMADRSALAVEEASTPLLRSLQVSAPKNVEGNRVAEPAPKPRRLVVPEASSNPADEAHGSVSSVAHEPAADARSDDPRERLDALIKHFDQKLKRSGGPSSGSGPPS
ncbi:hypothetical protein [Singulisphaera acidiphila]|uniref:Uncharacterized protein n=1 Tax=Singulisphaera acidiphila (strain ATCC BAA-1392 / DSM 18658 / VKM B-2454 / MOB10) TaxID=886293 RepID=L0DFU7_SINAD|nr:hypothetical protein [Singulisphaera acidiphila]AGA27693.1 hypothetical protein Sinac_3432 [Singulisphaera acidiphila DSM 18658]